MEQINFTDNMTELEKNTLVQQYEPLINKITKQYSDKVKASWEDLKSMAYEGFAIAINTYDETRSSMTFAQFAGFAIRNNILTSLNNELRTVKLSAYAQKKAIEKEMQSLTQYQSKQIGIQILKELEVLSRKICSILARRLSLMMETFSKLSIASLRKIFQ